MDMPESTQVVGPLSLGTADDASDLFAQPFNMPSGVYLFSIPCSDGYRVFYVGMSLDIKMRMREHIRQYLCGRYWLYEPEAIRAGILKPIHTPCEPEKFLKDAEAVLPKTLELLKLVRIFVLETPPDGRVLRRVESGLIDLLRNSQTENFKLENGQLSVWIPELERVKVKILGSEKVFGLQAELLA